MSPSPAEQSVGPGSLALQVDAEVLRGAPLHEALSGWGRHFRTPDDGMFNVDARKYQLSKSASSLDHFLSHDWASSRWLKLISLLVLHNSGPAFCISLATSLLVGILVSCELLPYSLWTAVFGHFSFFFVLCFWQRIRALFGRPLMVFLDILCIAQHDEKLKKKGIMGLGAFLVNSKSLVVLWTPRYFSRLWCTFEIATFMKDPEQRGHIQFMPLKMGAQVILSSIFWHIIGFSYAAFYMTNQAQKGAGLATTMTTSGLMLALAMLVVPFVLYLGLGFMQDLADLPRQLTEFRVQDAKCYCCSNNHKHPTTGQTLPCDRLVVFRTLRKWYNSKGTAEGGKMGEDHLDRFNTLVRSELAPQLVPSLEATGVPLRYIIFAVTTASHPSLCFFIPRWWSQVPGLDGWALFTLTVRFLVNWACFGTACLFAAGLTMKIGTLGMRLQQRKAFRSYWLMHALMMLPLVFVTGTVWFSVVLTKVLTEDTSLLPLLPFSFQVAITIALVGNVKVLHRHVPEPASMALGGNGGAGQDVQPTRADDEASEVEIFEV